FSQDMANNLMKFLQKSAEEKRQFLSDLPEDAPSQIQKLQDYEFMDPEAKRKFDELMEMLKQQVMDSMFNDMKQGMENMTPEQMQRMQDMLKQLNRMMKDKLQGKEPNFEQFKEQFGDMFPGDPQNLDQLLEQMQDQMQAMQSLMQSMSQGQREQLQGIMDGMLQDMGLRQQMMEMALSLGQLFPQERPQRYNFRGEDDVSLTQAMQVMEQLQELAQLEAQMRAAQMGDRDAVDRIDPEKVRDLLGEEEAQSLEALKRLEKQLEEAGYLKRDGNKLELTARALRKIGQKSLRDVFAQLKKDRVGNHQLERRGSRGERSMETKPYEFGDPFHLDLEETLMNSIQREGAGTPVRMNPNDFEVYREEHMTQSSTVLMLDLSRSMGLSGRFLAAKKTALALASLIRTMYPRDNIYLLGFSLYAQELKHDHLPQVSWNAWESGTNMHHGFSMARRLLAKHKGGTRQILMVTDGEPTAHIDRGQAYFYYPPTMRTIQETLKEVRRCTRENITINTFMLDQTSYLMEFVGEMAKINKGRVFYTSPERLGEYVLVDYLSQKRKQVR
ncbi:MAG: VWA domain-containing protein, partial [Chloroflexi bacterium]|nr:VWA domain-containing protein [Chloroflexota bacterium]